MTKKQEILLVEKLGSEIGYGHLMNLAAALWRKSLSNEGNHPVGAFIPALTMDIKNEHQKEYELDKANYDNIISQVYE